ncbi:MAG TPA: 3-isopropylmalate dehydrogenase [Candidatus Baltobacteraceae bacterium]|nr:3-isopropylmalate dehydrogenase [Candidatus Baltobacteraceae bacterium]
MIAVLPGDGVGPEVTREAVRVLAHVRPDIRCEEALVGGAALERGLPPLPDQTRALCERSDAILFGSVGMPQYDGKPMPERPEFALFALRSGFELYANIRPVRVFSGLEDASSLKSELVRGLDLIVLRELTGGIYFGKPSETRVENGVEIAVDTMLYRVPEIERIVHMGFQLAAARRKRLTSVDKENVLETSRLWRRVVERIAPEYPGVALEHLLVDNAAMQLVRRPARFDVVVTENMFGDILSDEAAILTGSIGTLPSASLGTRGTPGRRFGMYEPIGGTAPDIAGKHIANPTGAILSAALMLRHSFDDDRSALRIERAVAAVYEEGVRTADVAAGNVSVNTTGFTDAVISALAPVDTPAAP